MRNPEREVVVTGTGVCCHMGDDWAAIESALREGRSTPFTRWAPAVEHGTQCEVVGIYPNDLTPELLEIEKAQARFMGRAALLALRATRLALAQSQLPTREAAVVVGSGTGDVETHQEVSARLARSKGRAKVSPTVIPRLMASTVSANLATVLGATGPSFTATAACAGGAYNLLLAAQLIEFGHVDTAIAGGVEVADIHFHAGFDAMRAYTAKDNDRPDRASRPYAADRAGFVFSEGAGITGARDPGRGRGPGGDDPREPPGIRDVLGRHRQHGGPGRRRGGGGDATGARPRRLSPEDVDYVNTHGTSTPVGDVSEVQGHPHGLRRPAGAVLVDQGLHRPPGLGGGGHRGHLHPGDAPRGLDRPVRQPGRAGPGARGLSAGPRAGVPAR